ncbi:mucin-3B-like [Echeneis naucrates]|uniref:mucin-3B-like n=1 Tax=Echeneis naucrates TaxID=173247 RepID=UPI001113AF7C|nr:mucin-3B-like [Echeneis naucrates]
MSTFSSQTWTSIVTNVSQTSTTTTPITVTSPSPSVQCTDDDCQCATGTCMFNTTLGICSCHCDEFIFGGECSFGEDNTKPHLDTGAIPVRKANLTLAIQMDFQPAFNDLSSPESLEFINTLKQQLQAIFREADPQSFKSVEIVKLSKGSVIAESVAEYSYQNNETQIEFVNTQLDGVLTDILNDTSTLKKISQAFNNSSVTLNGLVFQPPTINNITGLNPYVNCSQFANYTAKIINGQWQCVGPCQTNQDYCHQHGQCFNDISKGPICRCFESSLKQFYGPQCDLFRWGPGFYGALFGSLGGALMIIIVIVIAIVAKKKYTGIWKRNNFYDNRLSAFFEQDFFDFSDTGHSKTFRGFELPS